MMYTHRWVIDAQGYYRFPVLVEIDGSGREAIQYYTLQTGESLVGVRVSSEAVRPKWDGKEWIEGATAEEIEEWRAHHPVPGPTLADRVADIEDALTEMMFGPGGSEESGSFPKPEGGAA